MTSDETPQGVAGSQPIPIQIMEIDITSLLEMNAFELSHSQAEGGPNAGPQSWQAAMSLADETDPPILDTEEKLQAMRDFARASGGWDKEEVNAWSPQEVNALFLQWIAGDVRQCPAKLEGVEFEEREGQWFYPDLENDEMEFGPFESRSEAYWNHADQSRPPRADSLDEIDWSEYETQASAGRISGNLFRTDDGRVFFSLYE